MKKPFHLCERKKEGKKTNKKYSIGNNVEWTKYVLPNGSLGNVDTEKVIWKIERIATIVTGRNAMSGDGGGGLFFEWGSGGVCFYKNSKIKIRYSPSMHSPLAMVLQQIAQLSLTKSWLCCQRLPMQSNLPSKCLHFRHWTNLLCWKCCYHLLMSMNCKIQKKKKSERNWAKKKLALI